MTLQELTNRLRELKSRGFIPSLRKSSTGIGYTLEHALGLKETNIPIPDIAGRVELKTTRRDANSLITLFCFNKGVWHIPQREFIKKYGYLDAQNRMALKNTVFYTHSTSLGLSLQINENSTISLIDKEANILATWDVFVLVSKLLTKLSRVLFVIADRKIVNGKEEFHYNEALLLSEPQHRNFIDAFKAGKVAIDIRMHLRDNLSVRNRGTGFRIKEMDMVSLYSNIKRLDI